MTNLSIGQSFPPGVINVIYGRGRETVGVLMESGKVDVFAFIGTNKGASELKKLHPKPHRLRAILGLDAKNPGIILKDVDQENAVKECVTGALSFNGQRCMALKVLWMQESIADRPTGGSPARHEPDPPQPTPCACNHSSSRPSCHSLEPRSGVMWASGSASRVRT